MSEITRVVIRTEHADGTVREYRALQPAGVRLTFTDDGGVEAQSDGRPVVFDVSLVVGDDS